MSALQHLRLADKPRRLWIDALCIDYSDIDEQGRKVRFMGEIFSKADRVVLWLEDECD
jgi:hypothetical protein